MEGAEVTIYGKNSMQILAIVAQLWDSGYKQSQDYDFYYHPASYSTDFGWEPKKTVFVFYSTDIATWFALKYVNVL